MCDQGSDEWSLYQHNPTLVSPTAGGKKLWMSMGTKSKLEEGKNVWNPIELFSNQVGCGWVGPVGRTYQLGFRTCGRDLVERCRDCVEEIK